MIIIDLVAHSKIVAKAMFTLYRIDFLSGSEIDPIQCEQCSGKSNQTGPDRCTDELFTPYRVNMLRVCIDLAKET